MRTVIPLREALSDPNLLGNILVGASWDRWKSLLLATAGEPLETDEERAHYKFLTGRDNPAADGTLAELLCVIGGRRGGKSRAMTTLLAWLASCVDWSEDLSLGERGRIMVIAPSIDQASNTMGYLREVFHENGLLASLVDRETQDEIHLKKKIVFEVQAASATTARGKTAIAILADESAFLRSGDDAVNRDVDIFTAVRPCLASTNGILLLTSSPSGEDGVVYDLYKRFYRPDGDPRVIVAKGSTKELNPKIRDSIITRAYAEDADAAASEYGAEFREPSAAYITRDIVESCIEKGAGPRRILPRVTYSAWVDLSSGTGADSTAACIGHTVRDGNRDITYIDYLYEVRPPFDPLEVIGDLCAKLKLWNIQTVTGDQYGKPYITAFGRAGITYQVAPINTSEVYLHALPSWTSRSVRLFEGFDDRAISQLVGLKRTYANGREKVDHGKSRNSHDDLAAAICGVIYLATPVERYAGNVAELGDKLIGVFKAPIQHLGDADAASDTMLAFMRTQNYGRAPDGGPGRNGSGQRGYAW
jgi:hypothetical protein